MLPLNQSFRQMMKKYIPQISNEQLNQYESLLGLRHRLYQEQSIFKHIPQKFPTSRKTKPGAGSPAVSARSLIPELTSAATEIFTNHDRAFAAAARLWIARRQFALEQGHFLQIPASWDSLRHYIKAYKNYRKVQVRTLPTLWSSKAKNFIESLTVGKIIIYGLLMVLVVIGCVAISFK